MRPERIRFLAWAGAIGVVLALPMGPAAAEPAEADRAAQSRQIIKGFATRLRAELVAAMKAGGPASAIPICHTAAPAIADEKAVETGWSVRRTAFKLRNPANAPDAWERAVLEDFQRQADRGADLARLEHYETVAHEGKRAFRYMKAIPVQEPCLTCHGGAVSAELKERIAKFYPQDQATGFALGDLRGAFSIVQPIK